MEYNLSDMFNIKGQIAVIVGAAGGIGREIALAMGCLGVKLALIDIKQDRLNKISEELTNMDFELVQLNTDITKKVDVEKMANTVQKHFGKIDILINSAGISYLQKAEDFDEEKWDQIIAINLKGAFLTCQAIGKIMLKQKKGRIINFSSVRGLQGRANDFAYAPSKGGINLLTKSLAIEWAKENINVNAIAPTFILTDINKEILENHETYQRILNRIPKGRLCSLKDIMGAVIFLCSPCSDFITGHVLYIDGGWTAA